MDLGSVWEGGSLGSLEGPPSWCLGSKEESRLFPASPASGGADGAWDSAAHRPARLESPGGAARARALTRARPGCGARLRGPPRALPPAATRSSPRGRRPGGRRRGSSRAWALRGRAGEP